MDIVTLALYSTLAYALKPSFFLACSSAITTIVSSHFQLLFSIVGIFCCLSVSHTGCASRVASFDLWSTIKTLCTRETVGPSSRFLSLCLCCEMCCCVIDVSCLTNKECGIVKVTYASSECIEIEIIRSAGIKRIDSRPVFDSFLKRDFSLVEPERCRT